jgi:hypothetical protein
MTILKKLLVWFGGGLLFLQSLVTTLRWAQGEIVPDALDWAWIALFPPLLYGYLRHVSLFGCKEPACLVPGKEPPQG